MEIIDSHAHIYPAKIAAKATQAIGGFYDIKMNFESGDAGTLVKEGKAAGISRFIVHSCATKPEQVRPINEFIKREMDEHKEFIGLMTLHQDLTEEDVKNEIEWCVKNGFHGIKLHPDFQHFNIDDEKALKFYDAVNSLDISFPFLFHTGDDRYEYSKPWRLAKIAKKYPKLKFIGAHFGGYRSWDQLDVYLDTPNVFFDTSSSLAFIGEKKAGELIKKFGAERFFFGTDFPMWNATEEKERFLKIDLTEEERRLIFAENIKNLLGL